MSKDGSKYPDWFEIPCKHCGKLVRIFCFTRKDYKVLPHFCFDRPCLEEYYTKTLKGTSLKVTIARLTAMRHNRNRRVEEYHAKEEAVAAFDIFYNPPSPETMLAIRQRDQEYIQQLRKHRGLRV